MLRVFGTILISPTYCAYQGPGDIDAAGIAISSLTPAMPLNLLAPRTPRSWLLELYWFMVGICNHYWNYILSISIDIMISVIEIGYTLDIYNYRDLRGSCWWCWCELCSLGRQRSLELRSCIPRWWVRYPSDRNSCPAKLCSTTPLVQLRVRSASRSIGASRASTRSWNRVEYSVAARNQSLFSTPAIPCLVMLFNDLGHLNYGHAAACLLVIDCHCHL